MTQFFFASLYEIGLGVPENDVEAYLWISLGIDVLSGKQNPQPIDLKGVLDQRAKIRKRLSDEQFSEAERRVATFVPKMERVPQNGEFTVESRRSRF